MFKNYFKIAFRNFWRNKFFTLINVVGLAIGISAALVIYLIVQFDFTFDKFHPDGERIYRIVTNSTFSGETSYNSGVPVPLAEAVKDEVTGVQSSAPFELANTCNVLIYNGKNQPKKFKKQENMVYADQRYFSMFPYKWLAGSPKTALNEPYQVVLTAVQAKKYFPKLSFANMLGKQIIYDDTVKTTVTGVVREFNENSDFTFQHFISFETMKTLSDLKFELQEWGGITSASQLFVKLSPGTNIKNIEKQLVNSLKKHHPPMLDDNGSKEDFKLQPLSDLHFNSKYYAYEKGVANKNVLYALIIIAVFLLLLGCINFINLATAQASQRAKEIGIRKTMGSSRAQLMSQYLIETFLVTLFAVLIAVFLTPVILKLFADFIPVGVKADFVHRPDIILFLMILSVLISFLSGFYPAMVLSGYKPVAVLKNQAYANTGKTRNSWLRKSLTVTQFMIAQFFIMATLLVSKQIYFALHTDLGFRKDAIIYLSTPWKDSNKDHKQVFIDKVKAIPQVAMLSLGGLTPLSGGWGSREITYKNGKREVKTDLQLKSGDENYIKVYQIKLLAGRNIQMSDTSSAMLINNTFAKILGFKSPREALGKNIPFEKDKQKQIVGVVADFHQASLHQAIKPLAIYPEKNSSTLHILLKPETVNGKEWSKAIQSIQQDWKEIYPDEDFDYHFFDETIAKFYESEQRTAKLLQWATGLAILISCLGLLGLAVYTTNMRTKEIGVRKVLGASVRQIVALLSTELILLVLIAFAIVTPLAWFAMHAWLQNFADRTTVSWWIFMVSGGGMLLIALVTLSFRTIKAALANPVKSLRSE